MEEESIPVVDDDNAEMVLRAFRIGTSQGLANNEVAFTIQFEGSPWYMLSVEALEILLYEIERVRSEITYHNPCYSEPEQAGTVQ